MKISCSYSAPSVSWTVLPAITEWPMTMLSTACALPIVATTPPARFGLPRSSVRGVPWTSFSTIVQPWISREPLDM